jgi:AAA+ superfamily predicted ATPase
MAMLATAEVEDAPYGGSLDHLRDELARIDLLIRGRVARVRRGDDNDGNDAWRGLSITDAEVDALLARVLGAPRWDAGDGALDDVRSLVDKLGTAIDRRCACTAAPLALVELAHRFALTRLDIDVLLIALAPEIDLRYERLYAYLHDDVTRKRPSIDLALQLLCHTLDDRFAARARFSARAPLIRHGIVQLVTDVPGASRLARSLEVDDRIVGWLHGSNDLEPRLARAARRVPWGRTGATFDQLELPGLVRDQLARLTAEIADPRGGPDPPIVYLHGPAGVGKRTTAEALAHVLGCDLLVLDCAALDSADDAAGAVVEAAEREAWLAGDILLCESADLVLTSERRNTRRALLDMLAAAPGPRVLTGAAPWEPGDTLRGRWFVQIDLAPPDADARLRLWRAALGGAALADIALPAVAARLRLTGGQIHDAAATARSIARLRAGAGAAIGAADIHEASGRHSGRRFGGLARKITARPGWDDLVLPPDRLLRLRELCDHARHRATVFERWGFDRKLPNGKGLGMLFAGAPGTGKTLAASVIAAELGLELYQIDLASVVSKWLGETEKHLGQIFDEAERGQGILLFDEADALFGKRSEVHDAHDRYANLETSYLLQRIEAYEGIVILASNFRRNMDEAFVRRLRFIIEFPLPDERERLAIWQRIWPAETPLGPDLDVAYLARRFDLAGAHLRNIALAAAFLAAAEHCPVGQRHALHAARREYQKLGKMIDESAFGGRP